MFDFQEEKNRKRNKLTGNNGAPLTHTLSANRTRLGRERNFARLPADKSVDLRPGQWLIAGWHTNSVTSFSHDRTNWITWSRGASLTSSPLTDNIWSPGSNWPKKNKSKNGKTQWKWCIENAHTTNNTNKASAQWCKMEKFITLSTLGPPSVTKRTITGFSLPATKPKPIFGFRCSTTRRGSGGFSSYW